MLNIFYSGNVEDSRGARLSPVVENDSSEDDVGVEDNGDEEGPDSYSDLPTGEEFSDEEDLPNTELPFYANCDQPYISGRTDTHHPVSDLCDISMFEYAGRIEQNLESKWELGPGKTFGCKKQLILAVCDFCCKNNVEVRTETSNKQRVVMSCIQKSRYEWRLYGRVESWNTNWKISTNPKDHTCYRPPGVFGHVKLTISLIAENVRDELKKNLSKTVDDIGGLIRARYPRIQPTYNKCWRGRERALEQLFGSWEGSYDKLPRLLEAMKSTTPGTKYNIVSWPTNDPNARMFKMAAWAFGPCIEALRWARPVISIDASFLSGRYKGRLFVVAGYDPENHIIPVAFGLAEKEEILSWGWFMSWVRSEVIGDKNKKYCVISDRHLSIKAVFASTEYGWKAQGPNAVAIHRYCMQHVAENLHKKAGGNEHRELKNFFKCKLANKKNPRRFRLRWQELKTTNRRAYRYLRNCGKNRESDPNEIPKLYKWAQSEDKGHRWGIMTTNVAESLNSVFRVERRLPVAAIVEGTWYKCARWMNKRTQEAFERMSSGERWAEAVQNKLNKHGEKSRSMHAFVVRLDLGEFEVKVPGPYRDGSGYEYETFRVIMPPVSDEIELEDLIYQEPQLGYTCECQKPQLTGIPCAHFIAVCREMRWDVNAFVDNRYSVWHQHTIWSKVPFHSYGDESEWPIYNGLTLVPDKDLINRGRRKVIRGEMAMDKMEGKKPGGPNPVVQEGRVQQVNDDNPSRHIQWKHFNLVAGTADHHQGPTVDEGTLH
ncbi:hypothetical protein LUZ61_013762 [Rhynchospora tenuis]|uniref:SWIM-type domain-containing protein n=1 Tax=Rhynchospora tenuis TaxID=198213 RepID=A0AAD5WB57_9POAL|nr:hypothetical protein LUZ61_013762 [Rhynchospora tenuis]